MLLVAAAASAADPADDLKALRGRIERLQRQLADSEDSKSEAADALRDSERAISETNRRLFELRAEQGAVRGQLSRVQARHGKLARSVRSQQELLASQLRQQYLGGEREPLRVVLSLQDPAELARRVRYLGYVSQARGERIARLRHDLAGLEELASQTRAREADLMELEGEQARSRARLEQERRTQASVLTQVSRQVAQQRREIGALRRNEQRLSRLVQRLAEELATRTRPLRDPADRLRNDEVPEAGLTGAFARLRGSLRLPVRGELVNRFGSPREADGALWKGLLIRARPGAQVRAIAGGRVVFADWLRGFGNLLILDHGDSYLSLYAYNEALLKQLGDRVGRGEAIALVGRSGGALVGSSGGAIVGRSRGAMVGNSGGSGETGLYFEIRHQGRPIDPLSWAVLK